MTAVLLLLLLLLNKQGVESERCANLQAAIAAGKPVYTDVQPSLADGSIRVLRPLL